MISVFIGTFSLVVFLIFQALGIPAGDSGDLVTAAASFGVAHPPGYPLYTFLGFVVSKIPLFTVSWRIGLLSSLFHAVAIILVYQIVLRITKNMLASLVACLMLLGNYVFFLYSVTPEVFALLDMFVLLITLFAILWDQTLQRRYFYYACLVVGLSLTHHHMILFLMPAVVWIVWQKRSALKQSHVSLLKGFMFMVFGFCVYLYVPLAARGSSPVNWDFAWNIQNFIHLITRADYGTFQSGIVMGALPEQRLIQIKVYLQMISTDISWPGVICVILGFYSLWVTHRRYFWYFFVSVLSLGPLFYYYASFPLNVRFSIGTYERFLLPSYMVLYSMIGVGFSWLIDSVRKISSSHVSRRILVASVCIFGCIYPLLLGITTARKFIGYRTDLTAELLARDILASLPVDSVLVMDRDTPLFTAQYLHYIQNVRQDVILLHGSKMLFEDYQQYVLHTYPGLSGSEAKGLAFVQEFITKNVQKRRIFAYLKYPHDNQSYWIPYGLLYELVPQDRLPTLAQFKSENLRLWNTFHNPNTGILTRYNHLLLSDVRDVYSSARFEFGKHVLQNGDYEFAKQNFLDAISYGGDSQLSEIYSFLGLSEMLLKQCDAAIADFATSKKLAITPDNVITLYESLTYRDCVGNRQKAQQLYDQYVKKASNEEIPLKRL